MVMVDTSSGLAGTCYESEGGCCEEEAVRIFRAFFASSNPDGLFLSLSSLLRCVECSCVVSTTFCVFGVVQPETGSTTAACSRWWRPRRQSGRAPRTPPREAAVLLGLLVLVCVRVWNVEKGGSARESVCVNER